ncbi:MAG: hypothetical protein KAQ64_03520 [Candidatus Pacebacteria bacterium]|nr:hypothetical protein [Candidatus Paceibacterota bacterium]
MIVLDTTPTANVVITIIPDTNSTTDLATLTFTSANWNTLQIITVAAADDTDIEGDHTSANTDSNYDGISISSVTASIKDNDFAGGGLPVGSLGSPTQPEPTEENSAGGFKATVINQDENTITLKLYVGANTTKMAISNIPDFKNASIVPYQEEIEWKLLNVKYPIPNTIYIKFYTKYGVASEVISASINSNPNYIKDGDLIQNPNAEGLEQFDVYITKIINNKKYKRLILTPRIFESYSHFDKNKDNNPWNDITTTDKQTIDAFITSNLVRCQDEQRNINDPKVYELEPMSDTGTKHHFNLTAEQFTTKGYRWNEVFIINREERDWYEAGEEIRE